MSINISGAFDSGNITVLEASDPGNIRLAIRPDNASDFFQWFHFRLTGAKGQACSLALENAGEAAYTGGWEGYRVCASYDCQSWFRIDETSYTAGQLKFDCTPEHDRIYFAYFAPYSQDRHAHVVAEAGLHPEVSLRVLGQTLQGRDIDCLSIGMGAANIWVIARQHPGESMAQWWMDGFLSRLLDDEDEAAMALRAKARFHIVPNMNPDGSFLGNLRTNFAGANLNREWGVATAAHSPEVFHTIVAMDASPPALCLDVHGDEALPYNFIAGAEGIPNYTQKQADNLAAFLGAYKTASPDFQTDHGYPKTPAGKANLTFCTNYTAQAYDCLAMTLEMPFKDNANAPDAEFGWSPDRSADLGAAVLDAMLAVVDAL